MKNKNNEIITFEPINKEKIKSQIYEIRGYKVMLDSDIAKYFAIETKSLNRAMKRNVERFPNNFCFELTREEYRDILRCQIGTLELEQGKYSKYQPYVYTEQGVAMLTSCLHTDRAINASIQIMEAFVEMTHYLQQSKQLLPYQELHLLSNRQDIIEADIRKIKSEMVMKNDLTDFIKLFDNNIKDDEILILNGQPFKADLAYQKIFKKAKKSIIVIDDYVGIKTLNHLTKSKPNVKIIIISDNKRKTLTLQEYNDFITEYPNINISFIKSSNMIHDRYIVLDYETTNLNVYHCGGSSKDSGNKITTIMQISDTSEYKKMIKNLLINRPLILK